MMGWHLLISVVLAGVAGFITKAVGVDSPWPVVMGVVVFLLYWGISVIIVDDDIF